MNFYDFNFFSACRLICVYFHLNIYIYPLCLKQLTELFDCIVSLKDPKKVELIHTCYSQWITMIMGPETTKQNKNGPKYYVNLNYKHVIFFHFT